MFIGLKFARLTRPVTKHRKSLAITCFTHLNLTFGNEDTAMTQHLAPYTHFVLQSLYGSGYILRINMHAYKISVIHDIISFLRLN